MGDPRNVQLALDSTSNQIGGELVQRPASSFTEALWRSTATLQSFPARFDHRTVWRWHFYAGLFCIPFVLWLSVTGTIFLFHPQIQRLLDRSYDHLSITQRSTANAQVQAALAAVPGSTLDSYELPHTPTSAAQVLVDRGTRAVPRLCSSADPCHPQGRQRGLPRGYIHLPAAWGTADRQIWLVDCGARGELGGRHDPYRSFPVVAQRYERAGRCSLPTAWQQAAATFWKDIHAVTGIYVSFFALFLLLTGLPWAKGWGGYLKASGTSAPVMPSGRIGRPAAHDVLAARAARTRFSMVVWRE